MAPSSPHIAILGSLNIDCVSYVPHHPFPGETLTANHFTVAPGGKGANQAVACAKLSRSASNLDHGSAHVSMVGAVGSDGHGATIRKCLESHGVDVSGIRIVDDAKTGIAIIIVDEPDGQNRIILSPQANSSLRPAHFAAGLPAPRPDLLVMQLEIPIDTVLTALDAARAASVPVLLNPAPAQALPLDAYRRLAHLVVNETEASILSACAESDLDDPAGLRRVAGLFLERGVDNVVITLGARGVFYASSTSGTCALVPAQKCHVVETTAAGDTFVGSYALAVVHATGTDAFNIDAAVKAANRAAAITVSRTGSLASIPWRDELE
ncbi:hypothetical protein CDD81_2756 [Ophiocordyceps australis]|uniref:Ribokinase n=1 Tax=Ophiocordyceps australis TaxID=1399860 RepID=A0A2C5YED5_9HYPO|nr:hypothetical protein CDD81_2756 [Ophiocordyceps australis]